VSNKNVTADMEVRIKPFSAMILHFSKSGSHGKSLSAFSQLKAWKVWPAGAPERPLKGATDKAPAKVFPEY